MNKRHIAVIFLLILLSITGCEKTMDTVPDTMNISSYYPMEVGKYITYKLDSTVYINLNTIKTTKSYIVQDKIDEIFKDNLGRDAFKIRRKIRSNADTTLWIDNATFVVIPSEKNIEYIDNNLRFIKLVNPVNEIISWKGNAFIDGFTSQLRFYDNWDYIYENIGTPFSINQTTYPETITVNQVNRIDGDPSTKNFYYAITRSQEVYAKGIGLIYKDFLWESWQPSLFSYESTSFGIRLSIINHN
ncbi:MAG: hypothetical protein ACO29O_09380 [Chitinophagaceae bacterium]